jgi:hypothetical protein
LRKVPSSLLDNEPLCWSQCPAYIFVGPCEYISIFFARMWVLDFWVHDYQLLLQLGLCKSHVQWKNPKNTSREHGWMKKNTYKGGHGSDWARFHLFWKSIHTDRVLNPNSENPLDLKLFHWVLGVTGWFFCNSFSSRWVGPKATWANFHGFVTFVSNFYIYNTTWYNWLHFYLFIIIIIIFLMCVCQPDSKFGLFHAKSDSIE